jgi:hypothetical protein
LANQAESLIGPHTGEGREVRAAKKLVRVFRLPILVCFAEDIEGRFVGGGNFCRAKGIGSIVAKGGKRKGVAAMEEASKEAAEFTIGAYCDGDEGVVAVNNFADDCVCREGTSS